jgi:hypothetical protein
MTYKYTARTSQETHHVSATETNRLMLFGETVAVCFESHTEHTNPLCGLSRKVVCTYTLLSLRGIFCPWWLSRPRQITSPEPWCGPSGRGGSQDEPSLPDADRIHGDLTPPCLFAVTFITKSQTHWGNSIAGGGYGVCIKCTYCKCVRFDQEVYIQHANHFQTVNMLSNSERPPPPVMYSPRNAKR